MTYLQELEDNLRSTENQLSTLFHAHANIYQEIATQLQKHYSEQIIDEVDEVYAIGFDVWYSPESYSKHIQARVEPTDQLENIQKEMEYERNILNKLRDIMNLDEREFDVSVKLEEPQ